MPAYFFLLGTTPALSRLELSSVATTEPKLVGGDKLFHVELTGDATATGLFQRLGGFIKLYAEMVRFPIPAQPDQLLTQLADAMASKTLGGNLDFGFAEYGKSPFEQFSLQEIKEALKELGLKARYLRQSAGTGLPAAILLHQHKVQDWCVIYTETEVIVARTLAVQNIDDWTVRDRNKPYADRRKGMLPPKLARIMVNLAVGQTDSATLAEQKMLDPFCGSGTVLFEAAMIGLSSHGTDLDKTAIAGTLQNITWLKDTYGLKTAITTQIADATNLKLPFPPQSLDYVVTEPFLGKPKPNPADLPNIFKGLEKLYLGAFKHWTKWLKDGARLVVVLPYVQDGKRTFSHQNLIDKLKSFGYTLTVDPVLYARPQAVVQRQIVIFTWKQSNKEK